MYRKINNIKKTFLNQYNLYHNHPKLYFSTSNLTNDILNNYVLNNHTNINTRNKLFEEFKNKYNNTILSSIASKENATQSQHSIEISLKDGKKMTGLIGEITPLMVAKAKLKRSLIPNILYAKVIKILTLLSFRLNI